MAKKSYLILRTCNPDFSSYGGFVWPKMGHVKAPDWSPEAKCGNGLHGLLWGEGDARLLPTEGVVWLVARIYEYVDLGGKVKFPEADVMFSGPRDAAVAYLQKHSPAGTYPVFGTATAGDGGTAAAGYGGTATAGDGGTATAGYRGTATAGDCGTATAGDCGTATAGDSGTAAAGDCGTATAGDCGTATAGSEGVIQIKFWGRSRYRIAVGYIGENGLKPGVPYRVNNKGELIRA